MPSDVLTPMLTNDLSIRNKVAHVELLQGLARPVPRYAVTVTYRNRYRMTKKYVLFSEKKAKLKTKNITTTFGKSLFFS